MATNPNWFDFEGVSLLGTSGQNIEDIFKYLPEDVREDRNPADVMEDTIKWQNIAPTAPDTLYCYPYEGTDPFVLSKELPHVYFAGNQTTYSTKEFIHEDTRIRLISIPEFNETGQVVILDLESLTPSLLTIAV